jgi:hypothetical protein
VRALCSFEIASSRAQPLELRFHVGVALDRRLGLPDLLF